MEIIVPQPEILSDGSVDVWPTLGPQICDFMEERFIYGPGPLFGQPYKVRDDIRYIIYRAYEHFPDGYVFDFDGEKMDMSGRRHFQKVFVSLPKGSAKTEVAALIALTELHPDAPVRFAGYDYKAEGGLARGRSVLSPYIPLLAPTKDTLSDLAFGVAQEIARNIEDYDLFDVTDERIIINGEKDSILLPVAANPGALDGKKPTFQCFDETHRLITDRHIDSVKTMENNLPKRFVDDPWVLSISTAGDPSERSVARMQFEQGMKIAKGKEKAPQMFFYHRQTSDANAKFDTVGNRLRALKEASGEEASKYRDLLSVARQWDDEDADKTYLERVWCNRWVQSSQRAFDRDAFKDLGDEDLIIPAGAKVTLGFDGAITQDSTGLIMTEIETGTQNVVGIWERPSNAKKWQVPVSEVEDYIESIFQNYEVVLFYADPPYWGSTIAKFEGRYERRVVEWPTRNTNNMYYAIRAFSEAIDSGELSHEGNKVYVQHVANAGKNTLTQADGDGNFKYLLTKISKEKKYDACMAGILSWQARIDAISDGVLEPQEYELPRRIR